MSLQRLIFVPIFAAFLATSANAQLFKRPPKPDPKEHIPALVNTLQTDPDHRKRQSAAEELRDYDIKTFPEIMPALIDALKRDTDSRVRREAVDSIGKFLPVAQQAAYAVEQAAQNDPAFLVRTRAERQLGVWKILGHWRGQPTENKNIQTGEPPLAPTPSPKMGPGGSMPPPSAPNGLPAGPKVVAPPPPVPIAPMNSAPNGKSPVPVLVPPAGPALKETEQPPLVPTPSTAKPISGPLVPAVPSKNVKQTQEPPEEGPSLNPPK